MSAAPAAFFAADFAGGLEALEPEAFGLADDRLRAGVSAAFLPVDLSAGALLAAGAAFFLAAAPAAFFAADFTGGLEALEPEAFGLADDRLRAGASAAFSAAGSGLDSDAARGTVSLFAESASAAAGLSSVLSAMLRPQAEPESAKCERSSPPPTDRYSIALRSTASSQEAPGDFVLSAGSVAEWLVP